MKIVHPITAKDFYKAGHYFQYPIGTEMVYSNFTPRSDRLSNNPNKDGTIVFFGLQGVLQWLLVDLWNEGFFGLPREEAVGYYKRRMDTSLGPDAVSVEHIEALHTLGYLPIEIKALPEGSIVPMKVPVFTIRNTLPEFFWVTNMLETQLSSECWKPSTTATTAYAYYKILMKYAEETGAPKEFVPFQGHDFAARGVSGIYDYSSQAGHLLPFVGTDTISAIDYLEEYYDANAEKELIGCSVPATEHSVMCMGGQETELETFRRLIEDVYPSGIVSIVSDTWDFWKVLTETAPALKDKIMARKPDALGNAKVVFRPDSGDPVKIICGEEVFNINREWPEVEDLEEARDWLINYLSDKVAEETPHGKAGEWQPSMLVSFNDKTYKFQMEISWNRYDKQYYYQDGIEWAKLKEVELSPEQKGAVQCLWDEFGGTINESGYKVLDSHVGLIYGDSITLERAEAILAVLKARGFASCNVVFGIGSFTYQYVTRDTFGFAVKATAGRINGKDIEIFKDPATDSGTKKSAKGLLRVEYENGQYVLYDQQAWEQESQGELKTVFKDGKLYNQQSLAEIRHRLLTQ